MTTKDEITLSLLQDEGKFKLVERRGKSAVWKLFGQVFDVQSQSCLPLYGCYGCKVLYAENAGTGSLARHKCPLLKILANHADELLAEVKQEEPDESEFQPLPSTSLENEEQKTLDTLNSLLGSGQNIFTEGVKEEPIDETEMREVDVALDPQNMLNLAEIFGQVTHQVESGKLIEGPKDRSSKEVLFQMIEQKDPDIVLKEHKKLPTISTIERYHWDDDGNKFLKKTLYVICRCCNQMLTSAVGGHLNRHVKRCRGERSEEKKPSQLFSDPTPEPPVLESSRENNESIVSVVATYCIESFVNFCIVENRAFEKMIRTVSKNQEEDFPTATEIETEAKMIHDELRGKTYSKVIVAISQHRVSLVVDFGQHIANTVSVFARIRTDDTDFRIIPLGFGKLVEKPTPEKVFEQLAEICRGMKFKNTDIKRCSLISEPYPGVDACGTQYMSGYHKIDPDYRPLVKKNQMLFEVFDMITLCDKYRSLVQRWQSQMCFLDKDVWVLLTAALLL